MSNIFKLAIRNLLRYKRRTFLTSILITLGVVSVLLFISVSGSFKAMMVGQIPASMLGHLQIHKTSLNSGLGTFFSHTARKPWRFLSPGIILVRFSIMKPY